MTTCLEQRRRRSRGALLRACLAAFVALGIDLRAATAGVQSAIPDIAIPDIDIPDFVGAQRCGECHADEYAAWRDSHHDLAMAVAGSDSVLGDFNDVAVTFDAIDYRFFREDGAYLVRTLGADGAEQDFPVTHTFGWDPLQQYLIPFPDGRLQALNVAWDTRPAAAGGQRWFDLYPEQTLAPGDPLHWTGRDQTWNFMCAECHSTGLEKNYDVTQGGYQTQWAEINVACESCHGPGAKHVSWAQAGAGDGSGTGSDDPELAVRLGAATPGAWHTDPVAGTPRYTGAPRDGVEIEMCGRCHSRRSVTSAAYVPGRPLLDSHRLALLDEDLYFADGQIKDEVYVYGSFVQSAMYRAGVTCSDCHEPHALTLRASGNALCTRCHDSGGYDGPAHHHHPVDSPGASCVECHMPARAYMVIDPRRDHSLRIPRPALAAQLDSPDACTGCHTDRSQQWAATEVREWFGESMADAGHFGRALHAGRIGLPDAADRLLSLAGDARQPGIARASALGLLPASVGPDLELTLSRLLAETDPLVRFGALRALDRVDLQTRYRLAWPLLADPVRTVRTEAARVLAPIPAQRLAPQDLDLLDSVVEEYLASQRVNAERPESYLNIGLVELDRGNAEAAERAYRDALRLAPDFAPAWANLADLFRARGMDAEGARVLRRGLQAASEQATLYHALGLLEIRRGNSTDAVAALAEAARLTPEQVRYRYVYAIALHSTGDSARAAEELSDALRQAPYDENLLLALSTINRDRGEWDEALRYARELTRLYPQQAAYRELEAQIGAQAPP